MARCVYRCVRSTFEAKRQTEQERDRLEEVLDEVFELDEESNGRA